MNQTHSSPWHQFADKAHEEYAKNEAIIAAGYDPFAIPFDANEYRDDIGSIADGEDTEEDIEDCNIVMGSIERGYPANEAYYKNFPRGPPFKLPLVFLNVDSNGNSKGGATYTLHGTPFEKCDDGGKVEEKGITWRLVPSWDVVVQPGDIVWNSFPIIEPHTQSNSATNAARTPTAPSSRQKLFNIGMYGLGMRLVFKLGWHIGAGLGKEMGGRSELVKVKRIPREAGLGWTKKSPKNASLKDIPEYFMKQTKILFIRSESDAIKYHDARTGKKNNSTIPELDFFADYVYGAPTTSTYVTKKRLTDPEKERLSNDRKSIVESVQERILNLGIDNCNPPHHVKKITVCRQKMVGWDGFDKENWVRRIVGVDGENW